MRWVTWQDVGLDRVACAWLIQQWIDPQAEIRYLAAEAIPAEVVAGALPFHNTADEEATWEERSSFPQLLAEYKLDARVPPWCGWRRLCRGRNGTRTPLRLNRHTWRPV